MRISDWSSDVCSSDLGLLAGRLVGSQKPARLIVQPCPHGKNSRSGERPVFSRTTLKCPQNSGLRVVATCVPQATTRGFRLLFLQTRSRTEETRGGKGCVRKRKAWQTPVYKKNKNKK